MWKWVKKAARLVTSWIKMGYDKNAEDGVIDGK